MTPDQEQWNARVQAEKSERLMRRAKERGGDLDFVVPEPKPGSRHPFKHAAKLYTEIVETRARLQSNLFALQEALAAFPPYVSRGHGWRRPIKNRTLAGILNQHESKPYDNPGRSEAARRVFQSLPANQRRIAREIEVGI